MLSMNDSGADLGSVGLVRPKKLEVDEPLRLASGDELPRYELMYETYGRLNPAASNAILICHALSGNHHAAGYHHKEDDQPGWWDALIGPGKAIDTNRFFVVASNNLGGCDGSSGPLSINPRTGKSYGGDFPVVTVKDWVNSQIRLADALGINRWAAVVGGSLGAMQALQWAISFPARLQAAVLIAGAASLSAQNIAFNEVARQAILRDPTFQVQGQGAARAGLMVARMIGHITYLSEDAMLSKFGRKLIKKVFSYQFDRDFQVENYLHYQGEKFARRFNPHTYLLMTKALDYFDPAAERGGDFKLALTPAKCSFLLISFTTDWRFPSAGSRRMVQSLVDAGKDVSYVEVETESGHDSFLFPLVRYVETLRLFLSKLPLS